MRGRDHHRWRPEQGDDRGQRKGNRIPALEIEDRREQRWRKGRRSG
jgi:hypothetical protein